MAWTLEGLTMEMCTCPSFCVCNLGAVDLPQGHSGACVWDIQHGHSDGVDLSGLLAAMAYDMSGDFHSSGTGRIYLDARADGEQRQALEAILTGERGGVFGSFADSISSLLPVRSVTISMTDGDEPVAQVGDVARITLRRHRTHSGKQTTLNDAEYTEAFGVTSEELADASGSRWSDADLRQWDGGAGGIARFTLSS